MIQRVITYRCTKCNSINIGKNGTDYKGKQKVTCILGLTLTTSNSIANLSQGWYASSWEGKGASLQRLLRSLRLSL